MEEEYTEEFNLGGVEVSSDESTLEPPELPEAQDHTEESMEILEEAMVTGTFNDEVYDAINTVLLRAHEILQKLGGVVV